MKKRSHFFIIQVLVMIALCISPELLLAQGPGKSGARIQRTNWSNSMECDFKLDDCVVLAEDELLWFKLIAQFADPNISDYPPMYFRYFFPDYNPSFPLFGITPVITQDMVEPALLENGDSAYRAYIPFEFQLEEQCGGGGPARFPFGVEYQLMTKVGNAYVPYPAEAFPTLFPPDTFNIAPNGFARYMTLDRYICCSGKGHPCPGHVQSDQGASRSDGGIASWKDDPSGPVLFPNPFSNYVNLQSSEAILQEAFLLEIYDAQGRKVYQHIFAATASERSKMINTEQWSSGIYIFRFSSDHDAFVRKMIKE